VYISYIHNSLSYSIIFHQFSVTDGRRQKRARASRLCSRERNALVRTERESVLRQLQMQWTGKDHFGSGILRLKGSHNSCYVAQGILVSLRSPRPQLSPALDPGLEVVVLRGEQAVHSSSTPAVAPRQEVRTVVRSCPRLSYWISGAFQDLGSRD